MNEKPHRQADGTNLAQAPADASPAALQNLLAEAVSHHQMGRLAEAEQLYRRVIATDARNADALHLLGLIAHQVGRHDVAVQLIGAAIAINGSVADYHSNLGVALQEKGRTTDAITAYNAAISCKPDYAEAHANLGNALKEQGRLEDAITAYNAAIRYKPYFAVAHSSLGNALKEQGRLRDAINAHYAAISLNPCVAEAHTNLAVALLEDGWIEEAIKACKASIRCKQDFAGAHTNLGNALKEIGRIKEAIGAHHAAISLKPDFAEAYSNLGNALGDLGRIGQAVAAYQAAVNISPDFVSLYSNLILSMHYHPEIDDPAILAAALQFGARFKEDSAPGSYSNVRAPNRRLRIGYVSGDFHRHPVGWFLWPVLSSHDPNEVEVFCYSNSARSDDLTLKLRASAHHWRRIVGLSDHAAAAMIAEDKIDILVDLAGHASNNRLPMFALKPAPIQATWLGFWGTTGIKAVDYILTDNVTIPPGEEVNYTETILHLPGNRFCYGPPDYAPPVAPPPCLRNGHLTFGSFNNLTKVGAEVIELWSAVLRAVPGSRFLLKWRSLGDERIRQQLVRAFLAQGIGPERLEMRPASTHEDMLAQYGDIDIALDPFPFSGGLTSCEALWMGVPVITWPGAKAPSRQTFGFLQALGLTQLVAQTPADYIKIAAALAADQASLTRLRNSLRPDMAASPLCDGEAFARKLEFTYRKIWHHWCEGRPAAQFDNAQLAQE